jgi:hypothetical protein
VVTRQSYCHNLDHRSSRSKNTSLETPSASILYYEGCGFHWNVGTSLLTTWCRFPKTNHNITNRTPKLSKSKHESLTSEGPWYLQGLSLLCFRMFKHNFLMTVVSVSAVGLGTALHVVRSQARFPMVSLEFFIDIILPATLWSWGRLSL